MILLKNNMTKIYIESKIENNNIQYSLQYTKISRGVNTGILLLDNKYLVYKFIYCLRILMDNILNDNKPVKYNINNIYMELYITKKVLKISYPNLISIFDKVIFYGIFEPAYIGRDILKDIPEFIKELDDIKNKVLNNEFIT